MLLKRWVLLILCRYCSHWPGMWRLNLYRRATQFPFPNGTRRYRAKSGAVYDAPANDLIAKSLYFFGVFQRNLAACMQRLVKPGGMVLDVGANIGVFTVLLAKCVGPEGRVVAVDPGVKAADYLRRNVAQNGVKERVVVYQLALGDSEGTACLQVDPQGEELGSSKIAAQGEAVKMRTLDSLWRELGCSRFDLVKIDVEGSEKAVLQGAEEMFREAPPKACIVEFNQFYCKPEGAKWIWEYFYRRGYSAFDVYGKVIDAVPVDDVDVVFVG